MRSSPIRLIALPGLLALGLTACAASTPAPTAVPTATPKPTATALPTWTPTPIPTPTPVPPARLEIQWPDTVSPLTPVPVEVLIVPPPGLEANARIGATVMDPEAQVFATFDLTEREGDRYRAPDRLQLPLEPLAGYWWLIVHAESQLPIVGDPAIFYTIAPVVFRDLTGTVPSGVTMRVPTGFGEVVAQGDARAGGRVWAHGAGEVGLWWAPGPTEELLLSNALVVLEATYAADARYEAPSAASEALVSEWQGRPSVEFPEVWPGADGGPGRAWVIQGRDYWLYVLRVRGVGGDRIPILLEEAARTFHFVEPSD